MNAMSIDRPSPLTSPDYQRQFVEDGCWLRTWLRVHGPRITDAAVSLGAIGADTPAAVELQDALSAAEAAVAALRVECGA